MIKQSVVQKLQLMGCEIIDENDFALVYQKNGTEKLGLVLSDNEDNTKTIDIDSYELNNYFVITEESFGLANGLYVGNHFDNLLYPAFKRELYTYEHLLTHRARLQDSDRVIILKPLISGTDYNLVNYQGKFITVILDGDFIHHGDLILRREGLLLIVCFVSDRKSIKLFSIDDNFTNIKVLNRSRVVRIERTEPDREILYKRLI